ncbi:MAG: hypothetical protein ACO1OG_02890 [Devosia sp.]
MTEELSPTERFDRDMEPVPHRRTNRDEVIRLFVEPHFVDISLWSEASRRAEMASNREKMISYYEQFIAAVMQDAADGDELWICQSRFSGALIGHEGIGRVRNGAIVKYQKLAQH